jgi:hypothetical protein
MDQPPGHDQDHPEQQADKQASELKSQLRKEVAIWNAARDDVSARQAAELSVPVTPTPSQRPAKRAVRSKPAVAPAPVAANAAKKPFSMSFDGVTDAEHITYMIARGAR